MRNILASSCCTLNTHRIHFQIYTCLLLLLRPVVKNMLLTSFCCSPMYATVETFTITFLLFLYTKPIGILALYIPELKSTLLQAQGALWRHTLKVQMIRKQYPSSELLDFLVFTSDLEPIITAHQKDTCRGLTLPLPCKFIFLESFWKEKCTKEVLGSVQQRTACVIFHT